MLIDALAIGGTALTAVFLLPQLTHLVRFDDTAGVSTTWAAFGVLTNLAWVVYLGALGHWIAVMAPSIAVVAYGMTLFVMVRETRALMWLLTSMGYGLALSVVTGLGGLTALGWSLTLTPLIQMTPGVVAAYRTRRPTGLSPATWGLSVAEGAVWGSYGGLIGDLALVGYGVTTGAGSLLILARSLRARPGWSGGSVRTRRWVGEA